jgi:hypothetical protein
LGESDWQAAASAQFSKEISMKRFLPIVLVLLAVTPALSFSLGVVINPYSQVNLGDVTSASFPAYTTKYTGVFVNTTFDMGTSGAVVAGLDTYLFFSANSAFTTTKYDFYLEPNVQYVISAFSAKLGFPLDVASSTTGASVLPSFYLTPAYKMAIDKNTAVTVSLYKTTIYTDFTKLDLTPRIALSMGALGTYIQLKIPNLGLASGGQGMTLTPDVSCKLGGFTVEGLVDFGNLNKAGATLTVTPQVKLQYTTTVTF